MTQAALMNYLNKLPDAFRPKKSGGLEADIQLNFTDPQVGSWVVEIRPVECTLRQGKSDSPAITVDVDPKIFMDIQEGKIMANMAVSRAKMRLAGDMNLAFRLGSMFDFPGGLKFALL